jgi:hypothetical protein
MILNGSVPPSNGKRQPVGSVIDAYDIARAVSSEAMTQEVVRFAEQLQLSLSDHEWLRDWAARERVTLDMPAPLSERRLSIKELFRRNRRANP